MQSSQMMVAPSDLRPNPANPRRFFNPSAMSELVASVSTQGVIQPLLVRRLNDGALEIVAGERRWRAATEAGLSEIPVLVQDLSDEQALAAALVENVQRSQMNPAEEAEAASKILGLCGGDRAEAARRLGWTETVLEKRLGLMNCTQAVRDALVEGKISLGHAELVAALPKDKQDAILKAMVSMPKMPTVAELKAQIAAKACELATAIFDKSECGACPQNSATQGALFGEAIAEGRCTNRECFERKELTMLNEIKASLEGEYQEIRFVKPGDNEVVHKIKAEGPDGVGTEQATACRACARFGAAVSTVPGKKGLVFKDLCFDSVCHAGKVKDRVKAEVDARAAPAAASTGNGAAPATGKARGKEKSEPKAEAKAATTVHLGPALTTYRRQRWNDAVRRHIAVNPDQNRLSLVAFSLLGEGRNISSSKLSDVFKILTGNDGSFAGSDFGKVMAAVSGVPDDVIDKLTRAIAASIADGLEENRLKDVARTLGVDLSVTWQVNAYYLKLLTKAEIEYVCDQIGLKAHLGKDYSKAMSGKKEEIIKALMASSGFDFKGKIPGHMSFDAIK